HEAIGADRYSLLRLNRDRLAPLFGEHGQRRDQLSHQLVEIERLPREVHAAGVARRSISSSMLPMASLYSSGERVSTKPASPMPRMTASGVRSSWEASAVKRRSLSNDDSRRAKVSLMTAASRPISSCWHGTETRS